jgi:site-specific DNA-methyltransferase (adenine-specific)
MAQLHLGDCLEVLRGLPDGCVDAVVTDPPYGIALQSNGQWFRGSAEIAGDGNTRLAEYVHAACRDRGWPLAMFFSPYRWFTNEWRNVLVWHKGGNTGIGGDRETCWMRDVEMVGVAFNRPLNGPRDSSVLRFGNSRGFAAAAHPAEKPLPLMRYLIRKLTRPGDTVFDPFMGSGTTGVAAVMEGRDFVGVEINPDYFAIAQKRICEAEACRDGRGVGELFQWKENR